ncbi:nucleotidyltransferase family protein [candidate division KSB1 bacterium]|nr:nucleotidyltransferase family protein [candidate division KSB1 bacterium]
MKAMILAAGYGTRLRPLTDFKPKALVEISGMPLLEIVIRKLIGSGVSKIIINMHHFAEQIITFLRAKKNFGIRIETSFEPVILGTGGGIKNAANFFSDAQPFIVHNVDVISGIDLRAMLDFHHQHQGLATLAVQKRDTTRYLLFDSAYQLRGHTNLATGKTTPLAGGDENLITYAFSGIQILSPRILDYMPETGFSSIIETYLKCVAENQTIVGYDMRDAYWTDVGKQHSLLQIEEDIRDGKIRL